MKKIGILGSGIVAKTLGQGFIAHGYDVMMGTSSPAKLEKWAEETGGKSRIGSFKEAAHFGDIIVLAVKGDAAESITGSLASELKNKTVIDTTNPIDHTRPAVKGVLRYFTSSDESLMERLQALAPEAHFVKAFNSTGNGNMVNPQFKEGKPTMFICGNNPDAKKEVTDILDLFGWNTEDMGYAETAGAIESLCILWCAPGFNRNMWNHAFKLVK